MKPLLAAALSLAFVSSVFAADRVGPGVPNFWVRPGFKVTLAAEKFGNEARFIELDNKGRLYVSQPGFKKIVQLVDKDGDGVFETQTDFVTDKEAAHGMQFVDGYLWFSMKGAICKVKVNDDGTPGEVTTVVDGLPEGGGHWFRSICVTKDGFYTSIGDSGNLTPAEYDDNSDRQKIWKFDLDGKNKKLWSSGIRNTEKLRLRPGTDELWGCDHGSDNFGQPYGEGAANKADPSALKQPITDLNPPEEFNHYIEGGFYGHPFIVGDRVPRLEFKDRPDIAALAAKTIPPAYKGGAHWANNGWTFVTKDLLATPGDAFIAYHGSWNSQKPVGYQIHHVFFDKETGLPYGGYAIVKTIAEDAKDPREAMGRPVDVVEAADGSLLFSDDRMRRVYRITKE